MPSLKRNPFLRALRPTQWVKNLFVLAPLLFAQRLTDPESLFRAALAFLAFCCAASGVYLLNDLSDRERDQQHPTKKLRPIASGALSVPAAKVGIVGLWLTSGVLSLFLGKLFGFTIIAYLVINVLYSFFLRSVPIVDVSVIALGFLLRVVSGGEAIGVPLSHWIILNSFLLAFFMGLGKRYQELVTHGAESGRSSLAGYQPGWLRALLYSTGALTAAAYVMYAISAETHHAFGTGLISFTSPFPALAIGRFIQLCERREMSPTEAILKDAPFLVIVGLWSVLVILMVL